MVIYKVPILLYHHVAKSGDPAMTVSPDAFRRQIEQLVRPQRRVVSLESWIKTAREIDRHSRRPVVITFDDGSLDTYTEAFPILQRYQIPATLFMVTDWVGQSGFVNWDQLREMTAEGWTIGSHTKSHTYLPELPPSRWEAVVRGSKETLEDKLQRPVTFFSYPIGGYTEELMSCVQKTRYRAPCTPHRGNSFSFHPFRLSRIKMTEVSHPFVLWVKTSGYYEHFKRKKPSH